MTDPDEQLDWMYKELDFVRDTLVRMFQADTKAGCGFYDDDSWREEYRRLQDFSGYTGLTAVYDPGFEEEDTC